MEYYIPVEIQSLLSSYVNLLKCEFGDALVGVYIYGSVVTGYFKKEYSDIDFMTVINRNLNSSDVDIIQTIHRKLNKSNVYGYLLEGEYVNSNDIKDGIPNGQYPYFAFGEFQGYVNLKSFAWFQLRERGIAYYGDDFCDLAGSISWDEVRAELLDRLNNYWPEKINWKVLFFDRWQALIVLSVCRVYYALEKKSTISKDGGGEYALTKLDSEWNPIIREALRIQNKSKNSYYKSKLKRFFDTRKFVRYVSGICSAQF